LGHAVTDASKGAQVSQRRLNKLVK
jgi:hypothetical protein